MRVALVFLFLSALPAKAEVGIASVDYGRVTRFDAKGFRGKVATGEPYDGSIMAIAHRTRPLKSCVVVKYRKWTQIAVVNDRGPCLSARCQAMAPKSVRQRIADLTPALAKSINFPGLGPVELQSCLSH